MTLVITVPTFLLCLLAFGILFVCAFVMGIFIERVYWKRLIEEGLVIDRSYRNHGN